VTETPTGTSRPDPVRYPLARLPGRPQQVDLETFARIAGLHPDLLRRFVALSLVPATRDAAGRSCFSPSDVTVVARIQRLHAGLPLNYAAVGLVLDLLDRIEDLEAALPSRTIRPRTESIAAPRREAHGHRGS
jgi:chaperone modulatory protein CbpM